MQPRKPDFLNIELKKENSAASLRNLEAPSPSSSCSAKPGLVADPVGHSPAHAPVPREFRTMTSESVKRKDQESLVKTYLR